MPRCVAAVERPALPRRGPPAIKAGTRAVDTQAMDVVEAATDLSAQGAARTAGAALLRRSLDVEAAQAADLLRALPEPPASLDPHLGRRLDRYA